jgi:hypothetical protein
LVKLVVFAGYGGRKTASSEREALARRRRSLNALRVLHVRDDPIMHTNSLAIQITVAFLYTIIPTVRSTEPRHRSARYESHCSIRHPRFYGANVTARSANGILISIEGAYKR